VERNAAVCTAPITREAVVGSRGTTRSGLLTPVSPLASYFLKLGQKKVTKEKAAPTIGLFLRCSEKSGTARNSLSLKQRAVLVAFFFHFSGPINRGLSRRCLVASRRGLRKPGCKNPGFAMRLRQPRSGQSAARRWLRSTHEVGSISTFQRSSNKTFDTKHCHILRSMCSCDYLIVFGKS
jgi:hypothetical protein